MWLSQKLGICMFTPRKSLMFVKYVTRLSIKSLNTHLLILSNKKHHVCEICIKAFSLRGNLKTHLLNHSNEERH
ncbi:UNVERIFIED_CONTAM: hypothetical protein NCL1_58014, partial [Trichonephila clavipes]